MNPGLNQHGVEKILLPLFLQIVRLVIIRLFGIMVHHNQHKKEKKEKEGKKNQHKKEKKEEEEKKIDVRRG